LDRQERRNETRKVLILAVIAVVATVGIASAIEFLYASTGSQPSLASSNQVVHFTIVESDPPDPMAGMNGSYYKPLGTQWPIIQVPLGDTVVITVMNNDSREIHGFAIVHYDARGFSLAPGQQHTITFVATEVGTFRMYCNVFCAIHPYMQNGAVIVNS